MMKTLLQSIGNTPLVQLPFDTKGKIFAKLEYLNPGGSIKDRSALFMVEEAERLGLLKPGGTLIEATSGNQGIAIAMIGAIKGYKVIITVPERISMEKRGAMEAYGAKLVVCQSSPSIDDPMNYRNYAKRIQAETPNSFMPNQYFNLSNPMAHYTYLGPEIWKQTEGKITHFIAAAGTGGTVSGVGRFLKEKNPNIKIIAVDVAPSFHATKGKPTPYVLEGIGIDFDTPCLNEKVIDDFINIPDDEGLSMMKSMARTYGFLVGTASSAACAAIHRLMGSLTENDLVVTIFSDSGRSYLSKKYWEAEPILQPVYKAA